MMKRQLLIRLIVIARAQASIKLLFERQSDNMAYQDKIGPHDYNLVLHGDPKFSLQDISPPSAILRETYDRLNLKVNTTQ